MGRISRQRAYKSVDPFNKKNMKNNKEKDELYDRPPKKEDDDEFFTSKNFERKQEFLQKASSKAGKHKQDVKPKVKAAKKHTQLPGESRKQYMSRLDENIQEAVHDAMMDTKKLRKKRKTHLKQRDEKLKEKKKRKQTPQDFTSLKDDVKFGEIANEPPTNLALPRKAVSEKKTKNLHLSALLAKETKQQDGNNEDDPNSKKKKRKDMSHLEQQKFDMARQKAIDAYREIKKKKMVAQSNT